MSNDMYNISQILEKDDIILHNHDIVKKIDISKYQVREDEDYNYISQSDITTYYYFKHPRTLYKFLDTVIEKSYMFHDIITTPYFKMHYQININEQYITDNNINISANYLLIYVISIVKSVMKNNIRNIDKLEYVYCDKSDKSTNIHLYYPNLIVNKYHAKNIAILVLEKIKKENKYKLSTEYINSIIDVTIYSNNIGICMINQLKDKVYYKINKKKSTYTDIPVKTRARYKLLALSSDNTCINFTPIFKRSYDYLNEKYDNSCEKLPYFSTKYVKELLEYKDIKDIIIKQGLVSGLNLLNKSTRVSYDKLLDICILCYNFGKYGIEQWNIFIKHYINNDIDEGILKHNNDIRYHSNVHYLSNSCYKFNKLFEWIMIDNNNDIYNTYITNNKLLFDTIYINNIIQLENMYNNQDTGYIDIYYNRYCETLVCSCEKSKYFYLFNDDTKLWEVKTINHIIGHYMNNMRLLVKPLVDHYKNIAIKLNLECEYDKAKKMDKKANDIKYNNAFYKTYLAKQQQIHILSRFHKKDFCEKINTRKDLLPVKNGVINLKTGELRNRTRHDLFSYELDIEWHGLEYDTSCIDTFIDDLMLGDIELIKYVQKIMGYSITGYTFEQLFIILWGNGSNGKHLFIDIFKELFGQFIAKLPKDILIKDNNTIGATLPYLTKLFGLRIGIIEENNLKEILNEEIIKEITSGNDIKIRPLFKNEIKIKSMFQLFLCTNNKPGFNINKTTEKKVKIIPFLAEFKPYNTYDKTNPTNKLINKNIKLILLQNLDQLLTWVVKGSIKYFQEGLDIVPSKIIINSHQYIHENDNIDDFINNNYKKTNTGFTTHSDIYSRFLDKYKENISKKHFTQQLLDKGYMRQKKRGSRGFKGLELINNKK